MAQSSLFVITALVSMSASMAAKIGDMEQGAAFTKCISVSDYTSKTLADDITLIDREESGCCPDDSLPGVKMYSQYMGAQVVCGFKEDGSYELKTGSSDGAKTCTYNTCYVMKQDLTCKDGTKQLLNGCCGAKPQTNFDADCMSYDYSITTAYDDKVEYCLTYHKNYKMEGTSDKADDQAEGKLLLDKLYVYTPCGGGSSSGTSGGTSGGTTGTGSTGGGGISCNYGTAVSYAGCEVSASTSTFVEYDCGSSYNSCISISGTTTVSGCTTTTMTGYCGAEGWDCDYYEKSWSAYKDVACNSCTENNCNSKEVGGGGSDVDSTLRMTAPIAIVLIFISMAWHA